MNVLIIKMGALGDLIMATPIIRRLCDHHANDSVWLLTSPPYARLFEGWPGLQVQAMPRKGLGAMLRTLARVRGGRFDRLYDLQSSERTGLISLLSGIRVRAGNHHGPAYTHHPPDRYIGQCHAQERLKQILISAGVTPGPDIPSLPVSEEAKNRVRDWLAARGLADRSFALMHAGASAKHAHKRWPHYAALALALKPGRIETLWIGGPDDRELNAALVAQTGIDTSGLFSLQEEIALGTHARFAVTNDSAPMHLLSCAGIPVFGLFGPTDWRRTHAVGQRDNVITAVGSATGTEERFVSRDIGTITVEQVLTRLQSAGLLSAQGPVS